MAKANKTWSVLPHRPLEELAENLWRVEGDLEGMPLKRVMTVARRADGGLVVHNAVALDEASMKRLDGFGKVSALVVPNGYHRLDAAVFKERYPEARVYCPAGARKKVEEVVAVDGAYEDVPADAAVSFATLDGTGQQEGVMVVRSAGGTTLVFNDAIFNMDNLPGLQGFVLKHLTQSTGGPRVSRIGKIFIVKDSAAFRAHLDRLAGTPGLVRVIVSHGAIEAKDPAGMIRKAAATVG
jgi:hypothetical protein